MTSVGRTEAAATATPRKTPGKAPGLMPSPPEQQLFGGAPAWARRLAVFDLETTGVDVTTCRIVTAHVGVIGPDGSVESSRQWLADPGVLIPDSATDVHGITTMRARAEGRAAREVVAEVLAALRDLLTAGLPLVVYNAVYDLSLLHHEALRHGLEPIVDPSPVVDPLIMDKFVDRYRPGKRTLTATTEQYGVLLDGAHDASADAIAAGRLAQALARRFPAAFGCTARELHEAQTRWARRQAEDFTEWMRVNRDPAFEKDGAWPVRLPASVS